MTPAGSARGGGEGGEGAAAGEGRSGSYPMVDLHSHVLPGVDDGAQDIDEAVAALRALEEEGVGTVAATPHFRASILERPGHEGDTLRRFDEAWERLLGARDDAGLGIEVTRGCEFRLDAPGVDLSDARLRLGGTRYALVEFASFQLPAFAGNQLERVREGGWMPLLAHPERYAGVESALDEVERWLSEGVLLQVNARSLTGTYGPEAERVARELLRRGWACCLASDYHARGRPRLDETRRWLEEAGGGGEAGPAVRALLRRNPERILADRETDPVPPLELPRLQRKGSWDAWFR